MPYIPEQSYSVLIPAHNEASGLPATLECIASETQALDVHGEIIVITNACTDDTPEIAEAWFATRGQDLRAEHTLVDTAERGKNRALNAGIRLARGAKLVVVDGDATIEPGGLGWVLRSLDAPETQASTLMHMGHADYIPADTKLAALTKMGELRRLAIPERYQLHGVCMAWNRNIDIKRSDSTFFPEETPAPDDAWLGWAINHHYGRGAFAVNYDLYARYIPPQTWSDYYSQQIRYRAAQDLVRVSFPEYETSMSDTRVYLANRFPDTIVQQTWRTLCIAEGVQFDEYWPLYDAMRRFLDAGKQIAYDELVTSNGLWSPVESTRLHA